MGRPVVKLLSCECSELCPELRSERSHSVIVSNERVSLGRSGRYVGRQAQTTAKPNSIMERTVDASAGTIHC